MALSQVIKGTILPKIKLKTLYEEDDSNNAQSGSLVELNKAYPSAAQARGSRSPFVKIGGQIVTDIDTLTIDETGFLPKVQLIFIDEFGMFGGDFFPKTDLIMSVYMKSSNPNLKPVRCDFLITSVKSNPIKDPKKFKSLTGETTYIIKGELYIPDLYKSVSKAYRDLSSKEALQRICEELGLGFAENDSAPNDHMTWINPNMSTLDFIKDIVEHAYQDDDSFFMAFIDKYYYLNFIEVNKQLRYEDPSLTFLTAANALAPDFNQKAAEEKNNDSFETEVDNFLTTFSESSTSPNFITEVSLISDHGNIVKNQGYFKEIYYYEHTKEADSPEEKVVSFFMTPLKTEGLDPSFFLIPQDESLQQNKINKWIDIDYGNAHQDWNASRLLNDLNIKELEKIQLKVSLNNINFQAIRGFAIPVIITMRESERIQKTLEASDSVQRDGINSKDNNQEVVDTQLSGYYYVKGAKYFYDRLSKSTLYTELFLARREWVPSKKIEENA